MLTAVNRPPMVPHGHVIPVGRQGAGDGEVVGVLFGTQLDELAAVVGNAECQHIAHEPGCMTTAG